MMLPIGTIVYLKEGTSKIMIINRGPIIKKDEGDILYDYTGVLYPLGFDINKMLYFNHENIDTVIFKGYEDEEEERFITVLNNMLESKKNQFEKGVIKKGIE